MKVVMAFTYTSSLQMQILYLCKSREYIEIKSSKLTNKRIFYFKCLEEIYF